MRADRGADGLDGPFVIVVMGLPGSGKTVLANLLVRRFSAHVVSRDEIRAAMFVPCAFTPEEKAASFVAVLEAVDANARLGRTSVVEGMPFSRVGEFEAVRDCAADSGLATYAVLCDVPVAVAQARVREQRRHGAPMADDRDEGLVTEVAARFRPPPASTLVLDATRAPDELLRTVVERIARDSGAPA